MIVTSSWRGIISSTWLRLLLGVYLTWGVKGTGADFSALKKEYEQDTRKILNQYCNGCHSTEKHKGDLDLEQFRELDHIRREARVWEKVLEQVETGEMPPKEKPQLSGAEKARLTKWVGAFLKAEGKASAGDPGRVILRRLSNFEYTQTVRALTGVMLDPAREFPVDGAAGEGFVNTGDSLVMSPSLLDKYFTAAKEVADHAVLLPDGFRFSVSEKHGDWVQELIQEIRTFYAKHTESEGGTRINLQGITFDTNRGGRLGVEKYLSITLKERAILAKGPAAIRSVARKHSVNSKYLESLWTLLNGREPLPLIDAIRTRWRNAKPGDSEALAKEIAGWQQSLTRFQTVGHIRPWMVPVNPVTARHEIREKLIVPTNSNAVTIHLVASDAGDGGDHDHVVWERPRISVPGRPDVLLRDLQDYVGYLTYRREKLMRGAERSLAAAGEILSRKENLDRSSLAQRHGIAPDLLNAWLGYLGIGSEEVIRLDYLTNRINRSANYDFVKGWGSPETPNLVANASDQAVRIPGNVKPWSVAMHPSPTLSVAAGWKSPITGRIAIEGTVTHAHPECGNGVTWSAELRRGAFRQRLGSGVSQGSKPVKIGPFESVQVQRGDLISILIGPRDGNHACDLTAVDLVLRSLEGTREKWDLGADVSKDIASANPHPDRLGNPEVWHFYTEPVLSSGDSAPVMPQGSYLAEWQSSPDPEARAKLAGLVQQLLVNGPQGGSDRDPNVKLYRQLTSLTGPLLWSEWQKRPAGSEVLHRSQASDWGVDPRLFDEGGNIHVKAPDTVEVRIPAELASGSELVTAGVMDAKGDADGSVQLRILNHKPLRMEGLVGATLKESQNGQGPWGSDNTQSSHAAPILVGKNSRIRPGIERGFDEFRRWFPAALCYPKIVPVDEVITLTVFHREDEPLCRLMLDDLEKAKLDRLWAELRHVGRDALTLVDAYAQLMEYATQDSNPKLFEHLREPIRKGAEDFRLKLRESEPRHLRQLMEFAMRAYRRPLTDGEKSELQDLYSSLRAQEMPHEEAFKLTLARVLVSPNFLYKVEQPAPGEKSKPVTDWELATRLSYFLWSSMPDDELLKRAGAGSLGRTDNLIDEARRMLKDPKIRAMAIEFTCQWLGINGFDAHDEKSERHFPTFGSLKDEMYEESVRFFTDLFQRDGSILELVAADHTFLNEPLAKHYGIEGVSGEAWRRVDGVGRYGRGGILGMATILSKQSGASRTSPILRGNWLVETLLGEKLPKPPKNVPRLPESETDTGDLTVRQITERHSTVPECAVCHVRIDPFGYALEGYDAIGRRREKDLAGRTLDTRVQLPVIARTEINGMPGLQNYLLSERRDDVVRNFCRKLLGYSLGRGLKISDGPLVEEMQAALKKNKYRFSSALEVILRSRQFRHQRGLEGTREISI